MPRIDQRLQQFVHVCNEKRPFLILPDEVASLAGQGRIDLVIHSHQSQMFEVGLGIQKSDIVRKDHDDTWFFLTLSPGGHDQQANNQNREVIQS